MATQTGTELLVNLREDAKRQLRQGMASFGFSALVAGAMLWLRPLTSASAKAALLPLALIALVFFGSAALFRTCRPRLSKAYRQAYSSAIGDSQLMLLLLDSELSGQLPIWGPIHLRPLKDGQTPPHISFQEKLRRVVNHIDLCCEQAGSKVNVVRYLLAGTWLERWLPGLRWVGQSLSSEAAHALLCTILLGIVWIWLAFNEGSGIWFGIAFSLVIPLVLAMLWPGSNSVRHVLTRLTATYTISGLLLGIILCARWLVNPDSTTGDMSFLGTFGMFYFFGLISIFESLKRSAAIDAIAEFLLTDDVALPE